MVTINNTKPQDWQESKTYYYGDTVYYCGIIFKCIAESSTGDNPGQDRDNTTWLPLDIYKKDATVMPHGHYSGDESMWERDQLYIDQAGWVYINNENTGINVRGQGGVGTVTFESLTPEQRESLRGAKGDIGPQGIQGPQGEQGPAGEVEWESLTPEQKESLKGDPGASAYEVWLTIPGNEGKSVEEFIQDITGPGIRIDQEISPTSRNPVENRAVYNYVRTYDTLIQQLNDRIEALENRLKASYHGEEIEFKFGVDADGEYGYIKQGTQQVIPFHIVDQPQIFSTFVEDAQTVLDGAIGYNSIPEVEQTLLGSRNVNLSAASISDDPSRTVGTSDENTLYAMNVQSMSFEDAFNSKTYMLRNGRFEGYEMPGSVLDGMTWVPGHNPESMNTSTNEGIYTDLTAGNNTSEVFFKVKPTTVGDTITYKIGVFNTTVEDDSITRVINRSVASKTGTINEETTISIPVSQGQGFYFASINSSPSYQIVEIYFG